ncbi:phage integrase SAM-like domain-containing protein [Flavobacterium sp. LS2P90]|uniref:Phage integrase SAM-like domain-containing protein n=1 Tax=Flavobacterium xylosi TaxID=3230415 RepID=A0ABW6HYG3_9FLAO
MKTKITLHFYAKSTKANAAGLLPIYVRLTVDGNRMEFSTKNFIDSAKWSPEMSKMKGNTENARSLNEYLDLMRSKIFDIQMELIHRNEPLTIEVFKNRLLGIHERQRMLIPIFEEHNRKVEELLGLEYAPGTLERYKTSLKHTKEFLQWKYSISDIEINKIDHSFVTEYEFYLRSVRKCANNTAVKYIKNFKKIIKICISNGWLDKDPFANYKSKIREVERDYLTQEQVQDIYSKVFVTERLNLVKNIFVFSCFTGLAYIDVKNLTVSNISMGIDGGKWIFTHRQKTETASRIPLLPIPEELILKYANHPQCINEDKLLPILSNQKMNSYLKGDSGRLRH